MAFVYGLMYRTSSVYLQGPRDTNTSDPAVFITTIPGIFEGIYGESVGISGLNYLAFGVGLSGASQVNARLLDWIYKKLKERNGGVGRPEFRLRTSTATPANSVPFPERLFFSDSPYVSWNDNTPYWSFPSRVVGSEERSLDRP